MGAYGPVVPCVVRDGPYALRTDECSCLRCKARRSRSAPPLCLTDALPRKEVAEFRQWCSGCGRQMLGRPIAKGGPNAYWQCEDCAHEQRRREVEEHCLAELMKDQNTEEQEEIIRFTRWGKGNAVIEAKAGSGKTSTIIRCYSQGVGKECKSIFIAFNKAIVQELMGRGMPSRTAHSVGWRAWKDAYTDYSCEAGELQQGSSDEEEVQKPKPLMKGKTHHLLVRLYPSLERKGKTSLTKKMSRFVKKLVSLAKNYGVGLPDCMQDTDDTWEWLVQHNSLQRYLQESQKDHVEPEEIKQGIAQAREVLDHSVESASRSPSEGGMIDFDDMMYMPLLTDVPFPKYDWIFVDEAQDLNMVRMLLVSKLSKATTRVIAVGDPCQAIYGFTGAAHDSLNSFTAKFSARQFSLTITWRCPRSHVDLANKLLQHFGRDELPMKAAPTAELGRIAGRWWRWWPPVDSREVTFANFPLRGSHDVAILCRTNAPLVMLHYKLLARGIPSHLKGGKEVVKELMDVIDQALGDVEVAKEPSLGQVQKALVKYRTRLSKGQSSKTQRAHEEDLLDCLEFCIGKLNSSDSRILLENELNRVFGSMGKGKHVTLSTVHKAKGLEWHSVYILQPFSVPLPFLAEPGPDSQVPEWEQVQEQNVAYVAVTRASKELLFLKHVKDLKEDPAKIVEVFGEEAAGAQSDEQWWDDQQREGVFDDQVDNAFPDLTLADAAEILKIDRRTATVADVRKAFKRKALEAHPDKVAEHLRVAFTAHFKRILAAKDLLMKHLVGGNP